MPPIKIEKVESWVNFTLSSLAQAGLIFLFFVDYRAHDKMQPELLASVAAISLLRQVPELIVTLRTKRDP